ncbi:MAG: cupin domain-containing protein, partial [Salinibacterium sp.]|nr:cupin domain-containing protein [Salinibacterium sp.]
MSERASSGDTRDPRAAVKQLIGRPAMREVIPRDPASSLRWQVHGYPDPLARWNFHPEIEIHLIRHGTGRYIIGDTVGVFGPGHVALIGSNLPHDWISDLGDGESIPDRDVVIQFDERWLKQCQAAIPELEALDRLIRRAAHGVEYFGDTARLAAEHMECIGVTTGAERVAR